MKYAVLHSSIKNGRKKTIIPNPLNIQSLESFLMEYKLMNMYKYGRKQQ